MRDTFSWGQAVGCAPGWPGRGIHDRAVGENMRSEGGEIHPGAVTASSVHLFYFLIIITSFSALKPIMSEL